MTQSDRRIYLIQYLLGENRGYRGLEIPSDGQEQKRLLRSLMNLRPPMPADMEFLKIQDAYLLEERGKKKLTAIGGLAPAQDGIYLWRGDITTLKVDAIVNAANSALLGCFVPCHGCIDNAIHSAAGVGLRLACHELMERQGREEETGKAKITGAFNLPCKYVIHTVGPIVRGELTEEDCRLLEACYRSCMELAAFQRLESVAFCCISTGEFHFPNERAAQIAVETVKRCQKENPCGMEVVFNVYKEEDESIYRELLGVN